MSYRDEARRALESSASRGTQNQHLTRIKEHCPALALFEDIDALIGFLRDPAADLDRKDAALLALVEQHQRDARGGALAILMVAMFPALDRIYRGRVRATQDRDELWARIIDAFATRVGRHPTQRRRARVAANLECDTLKELHRAWLSESRTETAEHALRDEAEPYLAELELMSPDVLGGDQLWLDDFSTPGAEPAPDYDVEEIAALDAAIAPLFEASRLDATDQALVVGAHVHGRRLGDLATELGISRTAAKARHRRAIARLQPYRHCRVRRQMYPVAG